MQAKWIIITLNVRLTFRVYSYLKIIGIEQSSRLNINDHSLENVYVPENKLQITTSHSSYLCINYQYELIETQKLTLESFASEFSSFQSHQRYTLRQLPAL